MAPLAVDQPEALQGVEPLVAPLEADRPLQPQVEQPVVLLEVEQPVVPLVAGPAMATSIYPQMLLATN